MNTNWLVNNKEWLFSGIGLTLIEILIKNFRNGLRKINIKNLKSNNIVLKLSSHKDSKPFSLMKISVNSIYEAKNKINKNGDIIIKSREIKLVDDTIKSKNTENKDEFYKYKDDLYMKFNYIKKMLFKALSEDVLCNQINKFSDLVNGIVDLNFQYLRQSDYSLSRKNFKKLNIYSISSKFNCSIYVTNEEYKCIFKKTNGGIEVSYLIICSDVFENNNKIYDLKILPEYLFYLILNDNKNIEQIKSMYISIG